MRTRFSATLRIADQWNVPILLQMKFIDSICFCSILFSKEFHLKRIESANSLLYIAIAMPKLSEIDFDVPRHKSVRSECVVRT